MLANESKNYRGLHIVVINGNDGRIEKAQVFDTFRSSETLEKFINAKTPDGSIIVVASQDDCTTNLSEKAVAWFESMGSSDILRLRYRCGFAFIGVLRLNSNDMHEQRSNNKKGKSSVTRVFNVSANPPPEESVSGDETSEEDEPDPNYTEYKLAEPTKSQNSGKETFDEFEQELNELK